MDGRFLTTGSLTHTSAQTGVEFHSYPFDGDLPDCGGEPQPVTGEVRVEKTDAETGNPLAGAEFELWQETNGTPGLQTGGADPDTRVGDTCTTGTDGLCARTVETGTYYWRETAAPDGYDLPDPNIFGPLVLTQANSDDGVQVTAVNLRTEEPDTEGTLTIKKTDAQNGKPLAGAVFELWKETNGTPGLQTSGTVPDTRVGQRCSTDARGDCTFDDLPLGEYYVREVAVPDGYRLPDDPASGPHELTEDNAEDGITVRLGNSRCEPGHHGYGADGYGHSGGYGDSGTGCGAPDGDSDSGKEYGDK
ncbi:MSCRAMM family protein [Streptomyces eurythermus]|uniref:MSCRAMM family protein n=1 Tax=Streptomyces eurythermus TaxID=42237 RepID=UPI0036FB1EDB